MVELTITITPGELCDRMTILERKLEHFQFDLEKSEVLQGEYVKLRELRKLLDIEAAQVLARLNQWVYALRQTNRSLWQLEDRVRQLAPNGVLTNTEDGPTFAACAMRIFMLNNDRAMIKQAINRLVGATETDPKSHKLR